MSKPLKKVIIFKGYVDEINQEVNTWLSDRSNDIYEYTIEWFGVSYHLVAVITYWEEKND